MSIENIRNHLFVRLEEFVDGYSMSLNNIDENTFQIMIEWEEGTFEYLFDKNDEPDQIWMLMFSKLLDNYKILMKRMLKFG